MAIALVAKEISRDAAFVCLVRTGSTEDISDKTAWTKLMTGKYLYLRAYIIIKVSILTFINDRERYKAPFYRLISVPYGDGSPDYEQITYTELCGPWRLHITGLSSDMECRTNSH